MYNYTKIQYFRNNTIWHEQELHDPTFKEVILLSGLPGTGKDTFIKENYPNLPVISLDNVRDELKVKHGEKEGEVINICKDRAKEFLRKKTSFVWNATNVNENTRKQLIDLFSSYHAYTKVIFLETGWNENIKRNNERIKRVPEGVICDMLSKLTLPENNEAEEVEWICV